MSDKEKHCFNCGTTIEGYAYQGCDCHIYCGWLCEQAQAAKSKA
jgi:hypothetical protein